MMTRLAVVTVALICTSGVVQAQSLDAKQASLPAQSIAQPEGNFKDEYGNLYNSRGDRIGQVSSRIKKVHHITTVEKTRKVESM